MRLLFWGLVAVALAYVAWAGMMSAWQYVQISGVVDDVMQPRSIAELGSAGAVKTKILSESAESGVPLADRDVSVTIDNRVYTVNIMWTFPVIIYRGEPVLAIPLSLKRSRQTAAALVPSGDGARAAARTHHRDTATPVFAA